ncbi:MAG: hypothetical protein JO340_06945 [Acidobacteriaceae bacterium]|nr:hypothetical protein [Acidobacteriaceae bacterium]
MRRTEEETRKSGLHLGRKSRQTHASLPICLGQSCPQQYPQAQAQIPTPIADALGAPLSIREAAHVIGCSPWTVRQRYLPAGLPHERPTPNGKLIFYRNQVIRWLLARQQKGGMKP